MADAALAAAPELEIPAFTDDVPLLEAVGITKLYGDFIANDAINLEIWPAEVHALLGENGAGKSTLVKMIYGLLQPSAGEFRWQGEPVVLAGPAAARARGIGMVFQHFSLFEQLTVAENVALGLDNAPLTGIEDRVAEVSKSYGLPLDPRREVWRLSVGERQRIEIVRCLLQDPKLLILDEPTSVLTPQEAEQLFRTLRVLRKEGRAILYISHKLEEVRALCDTATILRGGKVIATCDPRAETAQSLASMMVGGEVGAVRSDGSKKLGNRASWCAISTHAGRSAWREARRHHVRARGGRNPRLAGVAGNGQDELFAVLSGEALADEPRRSRSTAAMPDALDHRAAPARSRLRAGERLGHATAPRFTLSDNG
jgi:simple sugar transport system ATP-binding protein